MIHLIRSGTNKKNYAAVTVRNKQVVWETPKNQYTTKNGVYGAIRSLAKYYNGPHSVYQDDTLDKPVVLLLGRKGNPKVLHDNKPKPIYQPKKKVK